jgi:hypothetical protein
VREVQTTTYALKGVEASVSRDTEFSCKDFRTIIRSLSNASTEAGKHISIMEHGKFSIVGFIEPDDSDSKGWRSPSPDQEKRDRKRKEREDDDNELRAGSQQRRK